MDIIFNPPPEDAEWRIRYQYYIQLSGEDWAHSLQKNLLDIEDLFASLSDKQACLAYAPGKWSMKQVLGHMIDTERVMSYRAMCLARGEQQALPGFDENLYVEQASFNQRPLDSLLSELQHLRRANLSLFASFNADTLQRHGIANGLEVSVGGLCLIIAGHAIHHTHMLKEKYLPLLLR